MVGKTILVTSGKGGVGCSTVAARLAVAFARRGVSTLLVDLAWGNPAQDLLCGLAERTVYDALDVMCARVDPRRASLPVVAVQNLTLLPGATAFDGVPGDAETIRLFETLRGAFDQDVMILDVPKESVGVLSEFAERIGRRALGIRRRHARCVGLFGGVAARDGESEILQESDRSGGAQSLSDRPRYGETLSDRARGAGPRRAAAGGDPVRRAAARIRRFLERRTVSVKTAGRYSVQEPFDPADGWTRAASARLDPRAQTAQDPFENGEKTAGKRLKIKETEEETSWKLH